MDVVRLVVTFHLKDGTFDVTADRHDRAACDGGQDIIRFMIQFDECQRCNVVSRGRKPRDNRDPTVGAAVSRADFDVDEEREAGEDIQEPPCIARVRCTTTQVNIERCFSMSTSIDVGDDCWAVLSNVKAEVCACDVLMGVQIIGSIKVAVAVHVTLDDCVANDLPTFALQHRAVCQLAHAD